ncbi:DNA-binding transcriptional LysR family regulator [Neorhizobium galegae]|uniref:LysR family transcriptional regulator n=1 Tax=Neorhizobium galegae TaxID=399 RepID=UPI002789DD1A|nr:LysR family transcriptional regulator [Neorhizobium galegae]MDQ0137672.1 DNA-binding transcriptional LysR family regulator [Neorhizobium galegae]
MSIDSKQLRCFVEVATLGSMNKAAARLNISQSTLSRRMSQLEYEFNAPLFVRSSVGVELTTEGRRLFSKAIALENELLNLRNIAHDANAPIANNTLTFGMVPSANHMLLQRLLVMLASGMPDTMLRITEASHHLLDKELINETIDFALKSDTTIDPRLNFRTIWQDGLLLVAPKGLITTDLLVLQSLPFIVPTSDEGFKAILEKALRRLALKPKKLIEVTPSPSAKQLIKKGGGYSILPFSSIAEELEPTSNLFDFRLIHGTGINVGIAWRKGEAISDKADKISGYITDIIADIATKYPKGYITLDPP